jgi:RND superfamily putative drug exporter
MASILRRLGRASHRRRRLVVALWVAIAVGFGAAAATLSGPTVNSFELPGTESQEAFDLLDERFPDVAMDGATARVVFRADDGARLDSAAHRASVREVLDDLADQPQVQDVVDPYDTGLLTDDGAVALAEISYTAPYPDLDPGTTEALHDLAETSPVPGITVEVGGDALEPELAVGGELIGLLVAAIVLLLTLGSLVAAGMPLLTGITGVLVGLCGITAATGFTDLGATTPILALMLGLAVGIDYALFVLSRFRHELATGSEPEEAAGAAVATAGSAVVFAGLTVIIALAGLSVVGIDLLTEMGLAAAATVLVAVLIALTLLPALLGFAGRRVLPRRLRASTARPDEGGGFGRTWSVLVTRRPAAVLVLVAVVLGVLAVPVTALRLGFPDHGTYPEETTQRRAYDAIAEGFGPGLNGPLLVVVDVADSPDPRTAVAAVHREIEATDGVAGLTRPQFDAAADTAVVSVVPAEGPDSAATADLVRTIRDDAGAAARSAGAAVVVTGGTAVLIDFNETMGDALLRYLPVVVGLSFLLLLVVFRSIVVPVKATLGFLLTVGVTFGTLVAVFQWGWLEPLGIQPTGAVVSTLPILLIGIVFGLAMDYEVFLVTRMREEYVRGVAAVDAVRIGLGHGARVVAAAAAIMISVFGGFVLGDSSDIIQIGMALATAVAVDAFLVRMTIVPAVLALVGDRAWWLPRWLDRVVPHLDVEGPRDEAMVAPGAGVAAPRGEVR